MDGVLCGYGSLLEKMNKFRVFKILGVFEDLDPIPGAINSFNLLSNHFVKKF